MNCGGDLCSTMEQEWRYVTLIGGIGNSCFAILIFVVKLYIIIDIVPTPNYIIY